mmetsp:Transcript_7676/g.31746  ORF Transcript_7676/g.31746 Transcript_7676/m.31746 type:complete len:214 (+) Transcript_7676:412-1053(+)
MMMMSGAADAAATPKAAATTSWSSRGSGGSAGSDEGVDGALTAVCGGRHAAAGEPRSTTTRSPTPAAPREEGVVVANIRGGGRGVGEVDEDGEGVEAGEEGVEDEEQEELVVAHADGVVGPRAVVVELDDTAARDVAVVRARRFVRGAPVAPALLALPVRGPRGDGVAQPVRVGGQRLGALGHGAGVAQHGARVRDEGEDRERVERAGVDPRS